MEDDLTEAQKAKVESVRRRPATYAGGLIAISLLILQAFIPLDTLDAPETISVFALSIAIPILAGCVVVFSLAQLSVWTNRWVAVFLIAGVFIDFIGIAAAIFHLSWIGCLLFVVSAVATFTFIHQLPHQDVLP